MNLDLSGIFSAEELQETADIIERYMIDYEDDLSEQERHNCENLMLKYQALSTLLEFQNTARS